MEAALADLQELTELRNLATRTVTQMALDSAIETAKAALSAAEGAPAPPPPPPPPPPPTTAPVAADDAPTATASAAKARSNERPPPKLHPSVEFTPIETFGWDSGEYNSPWVNVYVTLEGVGSVKKDVECTFTNDGFDLTVKGLNGKNFRLLKDNLEHDIVPEESKRIVKKDRVTIKLKKVKGEYSYDTWNNLTAKKNKVEKQKKKDDPMGGIMDMMKDMYDSGDDQMKKVIGEAMLKSKQGGEMEKGLGGDFGSLGGGF